MNAQKETANLTPQQSRVLHLALLDDLSLPKISARLGITPRTASNYLSEAYRALGVRTGAQGHTLRLAALHRLIALGLLTLDTETRRLVPAGSKPLPKAVPEETGQKFSLQRKPGRPRKHLSPTALAEARALIALLYGACPASPMEPDKPMEPAVASRRAEWRAPVVESESPVTESLTWDRPRAAWRRTG